MAHAPAHSTPESARSWLNEVRPLVQRCLHEHGALFLRGLPMRTVEDFSALRDVLITEKAAYREKATPRSDFGSGVFSSTDLPPPPTIRPHNENSYALEFPGTLLFGCITAPMAGGATTVTDVRAVLKELAPLADKWRTKGWQLTRTYNGRFGLPWQESFGSDDRDEVERYCSENLIDARWTEDGALRPAHRPAAVGDDPASGQRR